MKEKDRLSEQHLQLMWSKRTDYPAIRGTRGRERKEKDVLENKRAENLPSSVKARTQHPRSSMASISSEAHTQTHYNQTVDTHSTHTRSMHGILSKIISRCLGRNLGGQMAVS